MLFQNFMKCIEDLSYSAMFASEENSKKFVFKPLQTTTKKVRVDKGPSQINSE